MKINLIIVLLIFSCAGCGSNNSSSDAEQTVKITVDDASDSYIEDAEANDNLSLLATECDFDFSGITSIVQYFSSELLGSDRVIRMDYYAPSLDSWNQNKYVVIDDSNSCNAPGVRVLIASDLANARATSDQESLYGCGATCTYTLNSETHDESDKYTSLSMSWECTNVGNNSLVTPGKFGNLIDKHVGNVLCE